jgi:hypothetical protein
MKVLADLGHDSMLYLTIVAEAFEGQKRWLKDHINCTRDHL